MAVPKRKTSKSKRNMRRSHHALDNVNVVIDKETGEYRLQHHLNPTDGKYNGKQIVVNNKKSEDNNEDEE